MVYDIGTYMASIASTCLLNESSLREPSTWGQGTQFYKRIRELSPQKIMFLKQKLNQS